MPRNLSAMANVAGYQDRFEPDGDSATVKSAKRVLQILELFKEARRPLSTTDIATLFNYPISSTAALLKSLATLGYLHFDRITRTYQTGYVYSSDRFFNGAGGVAGVIPAPSNEPPLVLGLSGPAEDVERDRQMLIELVVSAAREITTNVETSARELINGLGRCVTRPHAAPPGLALPDSPMRGPAVARCQSSRRAYAARK